MGLRDHYLGRSNVDNMATAAERKLNTTTYMGEMRRWNFERYVKVHVDQHSILRDLMQHGYAGIDERSKVRLLLEGIKTKELDHVKGQIYADSSLRNDFDRCVNLFQDFIKQRQEATGPTRQSNISAVNLARGPNDYDKVEPDMSVEDRYYSRDEYKKLSASKKKGLSIKRERRGHKRGSKSAKHKTQGKEFSRRQVKAIERMMRKQRLNDTDSESDDDSGGDTPTPKTNRQIKALKRKATGEKN